MVRKIKNIKKIKVKEMTSHDIRISVEHYINGGFGVIGEHFEVMGITELKQVEKYIREIMLKELGLIKLNEEK